MNEKRREDISRQGAEAKEALKALIRKTNDMRTAVANVGGGDDTSASGMAIYMKPEIFVEKNSKGECEHEGKL